MACIAAERNDISFRVDIKNTFPAFAIKVYVGNDGKAPLVLNLLKPTGHVMHQQFNIQQL